MLITKVADLLTTTERKQAGLMFGMMLVMAILDVLGIASVMPFMAVLADQDVVEKNYMLAQTYGLLGFSRPDSFLYFLGAMVFLLLIASLAFKAWTTYRQIRFSLLLEYSIGTRLVESYLHQPYVWFLNRHSADLGKAVLSEVNTFVSSAVIPLMTMFAQSAVTAALLILLLSINPMLAINSGLVLGFAYLLIFKRIGGLLSRLGEERFLANQHRFTAVSEAFAASKEVKILGLESEYVKRFSEPAKIYANNLSAAAVVAQTPRFALEAVAFGGMLLVLLYLMASQGSIAYALPIVTLYAFAGYRLIPAVQQIYGSLTQLRVAEVAVDALRNDLIGLDPVVKAKESEKPVQLRNSIVLRNVVFEYPNAESAALNGISLEIQAFRTIGFVGSTGSGKTTTVDLILGLLEPQQGTMSVDGQIIDRGNRRQWQKSIGYVPQQIFLSDASVAANIAFGVPSEEIDQESIERAAKIANLHQFVSAELPQGYATPVGERGVRLSGGQRQRIGIARALYHNPQVLILDEATSALDNLTEQAVMDAVSNLGHKITIILIAHRLSTVRDCDQVFLLEKGEIKAQGTYEQLVNSNDVFRAMAAL